VRDTHTNASGESYLTYSVNVWVELAACDKAKRFSHTHIYTHIPVHDPAHIVTLGGRTPYQ